MKWKTVQKKCGKQKEPGSDCTELRALLLFLLLWQAMFKVADRAIVLLLKFFKLFLSGIGNHPRNIVHDSKKSWPSEGQFY